MGFAFLSIMVITVGAAIRFVAPGMTIIGIERDAE